MSTTWIQLEWIIDLNRKLIVFSYWLRLSALFSGIFMGQKFYYLFSFQWCPWICHQRLKIIQMKIKCKRNCHRKERRRWGEDTKEKMPEYRIRLILSFCFSLFVLHPQSCSMVLSMLLGFSVLSIHSFEVEWNLYIKGFANLSLIRMKRVNIFAMFTFIGVQ